MREYEHHHLLNIFAYRPLLHLAKQEITKLCTKYGIPFVTDPTNEDSSTSRRNKIRNTLFPAMYALSHKPETFLQSRENIYTELEKTTNKKTFLLTPFTACSLWKAKFAYEVSALTQSRTDETTTQILRELKISHDMSGAQIRELTKFFYTAEQ
jgi:tRNA(Ile)-lysidine synthase TilS/MesJ